MRKPKSRERGKDSEGAEVNRRRAPRLPPSAIPSLKGARLLAGTEIRLINLSRGGALLETEARLVPGATICIRLVAADAVFLLRGRVLRSRASTLRGTNLLYECGVSFDEEFPLLTETKMEAQTDAASATAAPETQPAETREAPVAAAKAADAPANADSSQPPSFTVTVPVPRSGPDLRQIFGLNPW